MYMIRAIYCPIIQSIIKEKNVRIVQVLAIMLSIILNIIYLLLKKMKKYPVNVVTELDI